jgi:hypothetical protein
MIMRLCLLWRLAGKRMKAWNKQFYYTVKYLAIGGVLPAFLGDDRLQVIGISRPSQPLAPHSIAQGLPP